jgi:hypothetical protein
VEAGERGERGPSTIMVELISLSITQVDWHVLTLCNYFCLLNNNRMIHYLAFGMQPHYGSPNKTTTTWTEIRWYCDDDT